MTKCKACGNEYERKTLQHRFCSPECYFTHEAKERDKAAKEREKQSRREMKARKEAIKTRSEWAREAQVAFNAYIRARDAGLPCISCQRHHQGQMHAGHYLTVGARPELRFDELNCHAQCAPCNNHLSGNIVLYRVNLIKKVGQKNVEYLEGPHEAKKYTSEDLKAIKAHYKAKLKGLNNQQKEAA